MKKTVIEKLSEVAKLIKDKFEDSTDVTAEATTEEVSDDTAKFMEVSTVDGETVLSYDGELAEGVATTIFAGEKTMISVVRMEPNSEGVRHSHA